MPAPTVYVHSIGVGKDYSSLVSWQIDNQRNLVSYNHIDIAEIYGCLSGWHYLTLDNWHTGPANYIEIRAASGYEHDGTGTPFNPNKAGIYCKYFSGDSPIDIREDYVRFTNLQFDLPDVRTPGTAYNCRSITTLGASGSIIVFDKCNFIGRHQPGAEGVFEFITTAVRGELPPYTQTCDVVFKNSSFIIHASPTKVGFLTSGIRVRTWLINNTIICYSKNVNFNVVAVGGYESYVYSQNNYYYAQKGFVYDPTPLSSGIIRLGGDITSNGEASYSSHRNVPFNNSNFISSTSGYENLNILVGSKLYRTGDNWPSYQTDWFKFTEQDWKNTYRWIPGETLLPGSGRYDVGCDQIAYVLPDRSASIGGFIQTPAPTDREFIAGSYIFGVTGNKLDLIGAMARGSVQGSGAFHIGGYAKVQPPFPTQSYKIGAFIQGWLPGEYTRYDICGGFARCDGGIPAPISIGGFMNAEPMIRIPDVTMGGQLLCYRGREATIGSYALGRPAVGEFAEAHCRTLVKARSSDIAGQGLNLDATLTLQSSGAADFHGRLMCYTTTQASFNAQFEVQKYLQYPQITALQANPLVSVPKNGKCVRVNVSFSGIMGDGSTWHSAYIDFGEPFNYKTGMPKPNYSVSGFTTQPPWSSYHDYCASGIYIITVRAVDNRGMVGMNTVMINLASGVPSWKIPQISISGQPRFGNVPDSVRVDFNLVASGSANDWGLNTYDNPLLLWSFGNGEYSQRRNPVTYYCCPGLYAPVARYLYKFAGSGVAHSGAYSMWVSDTLLLGYNR